MWRAAYHTLLLIVALVQYSQCGTIPEKDAKPSITFAETFSHNWPVSKKRVVPIYTHNFNQHRQFAWVTHDPSSLDKCEVTLVDTATSPPGEAVTRDVELQNAKKKKIVWDRLFLAERGKKSQKLTLSYSNEEAAKNNDWLLANVVIELSPKEVGTLDPTKPLVDPTPTPGGTLDPTKPLVDPTPTPGDTLDPTKPLVDPTPTPGGTLDPTKPLVDPTPTPGGTLDPTKPLVDPTPTPGGTLDPTKPLVDPTPTPGGTLDPTKPLVDPTPPAPTDPIVDLRSVDVWKPVVLNSTKGYIIAFDILGAEPSTNVMFVNGKSGKTDFIGNIEKRNVGKENHDSVDHLKLGSCWKEEQDIVCTQDSIYGEPILEETKLASAGDVDWFGVQNLKGPAILVLTGKCSGGKCDEGTLHKLEADNKVSMDVGLSGLDLQCAKPTVDGNYDEKIKGYCFNFVCIGSEIQYRRYCVTEDTVEK